MVVFLEVVVQLIYAASTARQHSRVQSRHPGRNPKLESSTLSYPAFEPLTERHAFRRACSTEYCSIDTHDSSSQPSHESVWLRMRTMISAAIEQYSEYHQQLVRWRYYALDGTHGVCRGLICLVSTNRKSFSCFHCSVSMIHSGDGSVAVADSQGFTSNRRDCASAQLCRPHNRSAFRSHP